jgi:hypothetical protein
VYFYRLGTVGRPNSRKMVSACRFCHDILLRGTNVKVL